MQYLCGKCQKVVTIIIVRTVRTKPHTPLQLILSSQRMLENYNYFNINQSSPASDMTLERHGLLIPFSLETYNLYSIAIQLKRLFDPTTFGISPPASVYTIEYRLSNTTQS